MSGQKTVNLPTQPKPLPLNNPAIALIPSRPKRATGKVVLECPRCCWIFEAQSPDRRHRACAFSKPDGSAVIEEPRVCRNPKCKKHFSLYWHKPARRANA